MQFSCLLRLLGLISLPFLGTSAVVRSSASFLDVSRQGGSSYDWDYDDEGQSWSQGSCASSGTDFNQSPVNISTTVAANTTDDDIFFFSYPSYEAPVKMVNDGRYLYTRFPNNNEDGKIGGFALGDSYPYHLSVTYYIYKMVIHTPSEHTFNGEKVPLELQLFHRKKDTAMTDDEPAPADTAVVAIGFAESADEASPFLKSLIDGGLPDQRGGTTLVNRAFPSELKFSELYKPVFGAQGEKAGFWDYTGSLTMPPCSGGVRWFVRQETLNAKKPTLDYFAEVVKKSSGGVPGNARQLQVVGPSRPVFPRFVQNAVHMMVFAPEEPAAFSEAYDKVKGHQKDFKEGLKGDSEGADAAMEGGADADSVVLSSNEYKECLNDVGTLKEETAMAQTQRDNECNKAEGYQKTMDGIAGGPARIEAAAKSASASKSCEDQGKVVAAKEGQAAERQTQCDAIKTKLEKMVSAKATLQCTPSKSCAFTDGTDVEGETFKYHTKKQNTIDECKAACGKDKDCTGIEHPKDGSYCKIWLNKRCDVSKGAENPGWSSDDALTACTK